MSVRNSRALKRNHLCAALIAALVLPIAAVAQDAATGQQAEAQQGPSTLDKVTVTGSRIKRAEIEGPTPVTVITADDIEKQGFSTIYDALNTLTQFTGSVQNELNQNGFTPNASFLNLRGLGPGYQLILVNGRRVADYPLPYNSQSNAVNLANIPAAAIERIEVLSGGASAIYGSDAVAGVVNIIMKSNYEGDLLTIRGGTTSRGGGDSGRLQWVGGKTGDAWSITYALEYLTREEIFASQRSFMDSYRDDPSVDPADAVATIGLRLRDRLIGTGLNSYIYPDGEDAASTCARFSEFELEARGTCGYFGYPATQQIRNSDENMTGYLYGTYDFDGGMQAFAQLSVASADAKIASATQFWQSGLVYDVNMDTIVDSQRIFTPSELGGLGAQQTRIKERSFDLSTGLRGTIFNGRFDWEAVISHSRYDLKVSQPRFLENKINEYFMGPATGQLDPYFGAYPVVSFNIDRYFSPLGADAYRSMITKVKTDAESEVTQGSLILSGDLFELPAGAMSFAATLEGARQKYDLTNDPRISPNYTGPEPIYNLTGTGGGGERDRYALGIEISIPIVDTFKVNLAGRYDKYDDVTNVDGAFTWSAGLEYRPIDSLLLRGNYATSFRAPDMHYVFAEESGFFVSVLDEYRCRRDGLDPNPPAGSPNPCGGSAYTYSVFGTRQGSRDLQEEEGESATVGFVWDISDSMSISMDAYRIKLEGQVQDINPSYLLREEAACLLGTDRDGNAVDPNSADCAFFTGLVTRTGVDEINDDEIDSYSSFPFNQSMLRTTGIDARWRYHWDTDRWGDFNFGVGWTHVLKLEDEQFPGSGIRNLRDHKQFFNFRSRANWEVNWERNDWAANLNGYRWGSLPNWAETGRIAPYIIWNATVQKKITEKATVGIAVNNLFDKLAPRDDTFNTYPFFWRAFSPIGREVFVNFSYKFN
ncbi:MULTISPECIES: TonB-dependent receptor [unclassified Pseudoxanthomonas]|uniref:TonB-dependent receptor plug domain-containing protein n=1 Tax=unclassified Pseudoxanthomonas TaxID=2645906 RepID=UPI001621DABA|nr:MULTISPECIES: TonB-dependent receptor [unclassified Pseudoxanthomonas]MBB3277212.1 outer membrane receptor protein involved in Fe transport [Pseudoxanthomonas sp. OG2]MBD9376478.1 TonB-dependent receptor [Pseudoxanthomonas sp. PXM04]MBV7473977.1 TonB-dependent receptor [Pseudoxanthomonas sp. PXM05]